MPAQQLPLAHTPQVERYLYFEASVARYRQQRLALSMQHRDEDDSRGMLATVARVLLDIHQRYTAAADAHPDVVTPPDLPELAPWDVRRLLRQRRAAVLAGCHVLISKLVTRGRQPSDHAVGRLVVELGGRLLDSYSADVTHVVAELFTGSVQRAADAGKHVVTKRWLEACMMLWARVAEAQFAVGRQ